MFETSLDYSSQRGATGLVGWRTRPCPKSRLNVRTMNDAIWWRSGTDPPSPIGFSSRRRANDTASTRRMHYGTTLEAAP